MFNLTNAQLPRLSSFSVTNFGPSNTVTVAILLTNCPTESVTVTCITNCLLGTSDASNRRSNVSIPVDGSIRNKGDNTSGKTEKVR